MDTNLPPRLQSDLTQQRQAYHQEIEAQLARWRADIATMEADMAGASLKHQITLQKYLTDLKAKLTQAEIQVDELKEKTGDAWTELQTDIDDLQQDISESVDQAQKEFHLISE